MVCHATEHEMLWIVHTVQFSLPHEQFSKSVLYGVCTDLCTCHRISVKTINSIPNLAVLLHRRGHLYRFDDFLTAWSEKLRAKEPTSMTVRLQKDVDKYKVESISLVYLQGTLHQSVSYKAVIWRMVTNFTTLSHVCLFQVNCYGERRLLVDFPTISEDIHLLCEDFQILSKGDLIASHWTFPKITEYFQSMPKISNRIRNCFDHILSEFYFKVRPLIQLAKSFG